jgi:hypothetical protein
VGDPYSAITQECLRKNRRKHLTTPTSLEMLKVENPELVNQISSVFVTVEPTAGGKQPSGQKMLYAYIGQANHP